MYLPEEILHSIAAYLEFGDLPKFSRLNRACNRHAQPWMYASLTPEYDRLYTLLRTLTARPGKVEYIRRLTLEHWYPFEDDMEETHGKFGKPPPVEEIIQLVAAVDGFSLTPKVAQRLQKGLEQSSTDAGLALLLCLCPNIEYLSINAACGIEDSLVMAILAETSPELSDGSLLSDSSKSKLLRWPLLKEARVEHWDTENYTTIDNVRPVMFLPALRTLRGEALGQEDLGQFPTPLRSGLRAIFLERSVLDADSLKTLLTACPDLLTLSVHWGDACVTDSWSGSWIQLGAVLREHGSHLEKLVINTTEDDLFFDNPHECLGSLTSMTSLRALQLPHDALLGRSYPPPHARRLKDILPKSLESFCIQLFDIHDEYRQECYKQLRELRNDPDFGELKDINHLALHGYEFIEEALDL
ncbi:hypothetical protein K461DRAFT_276001 [Myriangium duriaei CBS 260.36]|uniref:F-box domain-containing protein n=1 Tax=Myriangium duriaei CBS 260.36 TaxID=1168546 RepID=A0A9P4J3M4_9PEZI|nr:hypothetical protein K461DRAFT_276001 [Myriangium duriaei CBS 260.36]